MTQRPVKSVHLGDTGDGRQAFIIETEDGLRRAWFGRLYVETEGLDAKLTFKAEVAPDTAARWIMEP